MYRHGVLNQLLPPTTPSVSNPAPAPPLKFGGVSRIAVAAMGTGDAAWQTYPEMRAKLRRRFFKFIVPLARWENLGFPGTDLSSVQTFSKTTETCKVKLSSNAQITFPTRSRSEHPKVAGDLQSTDQETKKIL